MRTGKIMCCICASMLAVSLVTVDTLPAYAALEGSRAVAEIPETESEQPKAAPKAHETVMEGTKAASEEAGTEFTEPEEAPEETGTEFAEPEAASAEVGTEFAEPETASAEPRMVSPLEEPKEDDGLVRVDGELYNGYFMDSAGMFQMVTDGLAEPVTGMADAETEYYDYEAGMKKLERRTVFVDGRIYAGYYMDGGGVLYLASDEAVKAESAIVEKGTEYYSQGEGTKKLEKKTAFVAGQIYTGYYLTRKNEMYDVKKGFASLKTGAVGENTVYYGEKEQKSLKLSGKIFYVKGKAYTGYYLSKAGKLYYSKKGAYALKTGTVKAGTGYYNCKSDKTQKLSGQTLYVKGKAYTGHYLSKAGKMYTVKKGKTAPKNGTLKAKTGYYSAKAGKIQKLSRQTLYVKGKAYTGHYMNKAGKMYYAKKGKTALKNGIVQAGAKYYNYKTKKIRKLSKKTLYVKGKAYTGYYMSKSGKMYRAKKGTITLKNGVVKAGAGYYSAKAKKVCKLPQQTLYVAGKKYSGYYLDGNNYMYIVSGGTYTPVNTGLGAGTRYYSGKAGKMMTLPGLAVYIEGKPAEGMSTASLETLMRAQEVVARVTNSGMTREAKLKACFDYVKTYPESRVRVPHYRGMDWPVLYANDIFVGGTGNCFSYAAAFAYMARAIGYENVYCCHSGGHGWAEIDGLVYDPEWSKHHHGYSYYALSYSTRTDQDYRGAIGAGLPWMHVKI